MNSYSRYLSNWSPNGFKSINYFFNCFNSSSHKLNSCIQTVVSTSLNSNILNLHSQNSNSCDLNCSDSNSHNSNSHNLHSSNCYTCSFNIRDLSPRNANLYTKRARLTKNEPQQQGISYLDRKRGMWVGQQAGIYKVKLGLGEIKGRDRETER